ncbi:hypothetical protein [Cellulomonas soli]|uniref:Leucine-rich repeat domain-containing protein n=1 Tax=Cellulomonas soli TaxID=931535 RepID=A0A512PFJ6_9CELL|nr:hypothetical protein [Cellulomonas soli]NYI59893.1 hypothetical protein [Cellulomonas soli]GEP69963.1 hypothetical protein CSO01_26780 [Cellulomonas soli]
MDTDLGALMDDPTILTSVDEYAGQTQVQIAATQLGPAFSTAQARRIVTDWADFFEAGPSPIEDLQFVTRTPKRLFDALARQTQLRRLTLKWGDYDDLHALTGMADLLELRLRGASNVRSIDPLAELTSVETLEIDALRHARVLDAIGAMTSVRDLELGGDWMSIRVAHVDSIGFLAAMQNLERLRLHTIVVDDGDYSPIVSLPRLRSLRVMGTRGMTPTLEALQALTAWDGLDP